MSYRVSLPNDILLGKASELLADGVEVIIMTKGNSMLPFIVGDRDSVKLVRQPSVSVGDIVLAHVPYPGTERRRYILHRVIKVDGDSLTLMGDGNLRGTETCSVSDVKGTVREILKPGGRVVVARDAAWWRKIRPLRRYILAIYRRLI